MKGAWKYVAAFLMGIILTGGVSFLIARSAGAKLAADLAGVRTALEKSQRDRADLAEQLRLVHLELDRSSQLVASQQSELDADKSILAGQQHQLANQQQLLDAAKRGLAKLASDLAGSGDDIGKQIRAFAEGFRRLYRIYHPGGS